MAVNPNYAVSHSLDVAKTTAGTTTSLSPTPTAAPAESTTMPNAASPPEKIDDEFGSDVTYLTLKHVDGLPEPHVQEDLIKT